jgi:DNA-binding response OmpR family regulator
MDVLLVEDEPLVREAVAEALGEAGLDMAQADSAEHALAAVGLAAGEDAATAALSSAPPAGTGAATPPPPRRRCW